MPYTPPFKGGVSATVVQPRVATSLSASARRITHSRSASDMSLSSLPGAAAAIASVSAIGEDDDEDLIDSPESVSSDSADSIRMTAKMIRKKSGELVKPALRDSSRPRRPVSMPGTPTQTKAVHFGDNIQVRHFLWQDRPMAVSAGSSPVLAYESENEFPFPTIGLSTPVVPKWELRTTNWPSEAEQRARMNAPVRLEKVFLTTDGTSVVGSVAVANISFHKFVVCRFTYDHWTTVSEVVAEYSDDAVATTSKDKMAPLSPGYDRFVFTIRVADQARLDSRSLLACIRYSVGSEEHWDNNNSLNYQIDFVRNAPPAVRPSKPLGQAPSIPRSRRSARLRRSLTEPVPQADAAAVAPKVDGDADECPYAFRPRGRRSQALVSVDSDSDCPPIKLKPRARMVEPLVPEPTVRAPPFSTRYDFSLSPAAPVERPAAAVPPFPFADASRQAKVGSDEYQEILNRFCFFAPRDRASTRSSASPTSSPAVSPTLVQNQAGLSGRSSASDSASPERPSVKVVPELVPDSQGSDTSEEQASSNVSSPESSGSSTPPSPDIIPHSSLGLSFPGPASWPPSATSTPVPSSLDPELPDFPIFRPRSASPSALGGRGHHRHGHTHHAYSSPSIFSGQSPQFACIRG